MARVNFDGRFFEISQREDSMENRISRPLLLTIEEARNMVTRINILMKRRLKPIRLNSPRR